MIKDGTVTLGEYAQATQKSVACLRAAGFRVTEPELDERGLFVYGTSTSGGEPNDPKFDEKAAAIDAKVNSCARLSDAVQAVYVYEHAASKESQGRGLDQTVECARKAGVEIPTTAKPSHAGEILMAIRKAVSAKRITLETADRCTSYYRSVGLSPLPGIDKALAELRSDGS